MLIIDKKLQIFILTNFSGLNTIKNAISIGATIGGSILLLNLMLNILCAGYAKILKTRKKFLWAFSSKVL